MIVSSPEVVIKYTFSGHESFQCRHLWLKKGFDYIQSNKSFSDEDAVVRLGVGKNMVASIRYWLRAFNIIDSKDLPTEFGIKLLSDDGWDPFLEDDGSLWLLHYQLIKTNFASIYYIIFNDFRKEKLHFNKGSFVNYLKRRKELEENLNFNEKTVADDFVVFIKMYQNDITRKRDIEDSFSALLSDLDLLRTIGGGKEEQYQIENIERDSLPIGIVLFSILDNEGFGNSIGLSALENEVNSPGSIFALNRSSLQNMLIDLTKSNKFMTFTDHAGIKELQLKSKPNPFSILDKYYGK
jgi:hypothetical protein